MKNLFEQIKIENTEMTIAEVLESVFDTLEYDDGYIVGNREFRQLANEFGCYTEDCPESYDSTRTYTFLDGSQAVYNNPCQEAFTASFGAI